MSEHEQITKVEMETEEPKGKVSRRDFLRILGATPVVGAAACADRNVDTVLPFVKREEHQITGVASWFSTTCTECSAGCGIQVRVREGRAVKIEGNPQSPINKGGVCSIGHSALQDLYDPDRIRQPLKRKSDGSGFEAVSWDEAMAFVSQKLKESDKKKTFVGRPVGGSLEALLDNWCDAFGVKKVHFDSTSRAAEAKAAELTYGTYCIPTYQFDQAGVVLNFGADFLETWVSPCEFARGWSSTRKGEHPARLIHVEPRLSLTGANADMWLCANPGSELQLALIVLKQLIERGHGSNLSDGVLSEMRAITRDVDLRAAAAATGVGIEKIVLLVQYLSEAKSSLVLAGGAAAATSDPLPLMVVANFINLVLGNVGKTVNLVATRAPGASHEPLVAALAAMLNGDVHTLFVDASNPLFNLPPSMEVAYALKRVETVISFASHMDETTAQAHMILPANTGLESWGDAETVKGVFQLMQPTMKPVFDTRGMGDMLIESAKSAGKANIADGQSDFYGFLRTRWQAVQKRVGASGDFESFWRTSLERGGYYNAAVDGERAKVNVSSAAFRLNFAGEGAWDAKAAAPRGLKLLPFPSVRSFDGRAANRPWLHEIPDPITQTAWDGWIEMHPDTAKGRGLAQGDMVMVRNFWGEIEVPLYITPYVHRDVVAVPIGHGHQGYGRYAKQTNGNVMTLLPNALAEGTSTLPLFVTKVNVSRGRGKSTLVNVQGSDSQHGRELARTTTIAAAGAHAADGHGDGHGHGHGHAPKQMYNQREHPLYRWAMVVDLAACTGCSACVTACYAENNIAVVGKKLLNQGREMSWLRIERYFDGSADELQVSFLPMMCQHCGNAPCEPVCPVYATYHNEEGMNVMAYNRCVGTRYCSNNCSYKVRRYNWFEVTFPEPLNWQLNPDVVKRAGGVMEKCTFCVQRILEAKDNAKDQGRTVQDGEVKPACVQSCPSDALAFGNLNDKDSKVAHLAHDKRAYKILDHHLNTQPAVTYLEDVKYKQA